MAIFALPFGGLNIVLGLVTAKGGGVTVAPETQDPVKMIVDRGVIGSTIYVMAFSDKKLVLRRLSSGGLTVLAVVILAVIGLFFAGFIGAAIGGLTAFSLQEFLTQRRRNAAKSEGLLNASTRGDLEFAYSDLEKIQLTPTRLRLYLENGVMGIVVSRKTSKMMLPVLRQTVPSSKIPRET